MIKNIIFDWSGTISDDFKPVYEAAMITFEKLIGKRVSIEEFRRDFELPPIKYLIKHIPEELIEEQNKLFKEAIYKVASPTVLPSVEVVLRELKDRGLNLYVISSHPHEKLIIEAVSYGITEFFDEIKGSILNKPEGIEKITTKNNLKKEETFYVGDMTYDIEAGKEAGVKTVAVTYGYQDKEKLAKMNPDYIISDFKELLEIIK